MSDELNLEFAEVSKPEFTERTIFHVGVSGGKDSAAALLWLTREAGIAKEKIIATFCDTGNEHEWTYEHIKLLSERVHPIETIKAPLTFFDLALKNKRFPSPMARFCTQNLKIYPSQNFVQRLRLRGDVINVSGVRGDESPDRAKYPEWDYHGNLLCYQWRPLIRWSLADVLAIHRRHGIPLNPLYSAGAQRVGCWPCFMSRKAEIRNLALKFPERIDKIRAEEERHWREYGRRSSFFAAKKVPPQFRSMPHVCRDGHTEMVCTIDDVVRWSLTGSGAAGSWQDDPPEPSVISCNSGFCE